MGNAEYERWRSEGGIFAGLNWSRKKQNGFLKEVRKRFQGKGGGEVSYLYPWLDARHEVPKLREALGMSDEGMRKMVKRLAVRIIKSRKAKIGPDSIDWNGALVLLDARLDRSRSKKNNPAQRVWDVYASFHRSAPGFVELKSILESHGASCTPPAPIGGDLFGPFSSQL
ncbi:MAG: hypothetical protein EXS41_00335 [Opitutaceae bacterium]|nr:hypothetical protein [Opitutaceae bacterium]